MHWPLVTGAPLVRRTDSAGAELVCGGVDVAGRVAGLVDLGRVEGVRDGVAALDAEVVAVRDGCAEVAVAPPDEVSMGTPDDGEPGDGKPCRVAPCFAPVESDNNITASMTASAQATRANTAGRHTAR
ncbi:MAG: hypothetical protein ABI808_14825 [Pseudonocardiales bacterium]